MSLFVTPDSALALEHLCAARGLSIADMVRGAILFAAANDHVRFNASKGGRTRRVCFYIDLKTRQVIRETAVKEGLAMSAWLAGAVERFTTELQREAAGEAPSLELQRAHDRMRYLHSVAERELARREAQAG